MEQLLKCVLEQDAAPVVIRDYESRDCPVLAQLFYDTVHSINARDYTQAQLDAWATGEVDLTRWDHAFLNSHTLVAEDGKILGFANMDEKGYLDMLYVHKNHQGKGIATALCDALESACESESFTVHASITARPFFESRGYQVMKEQRVQRDGIVLTNFLMKKRKKQIF